MATSKGLPNKMLQDAESSQSTDHFLDDLLEDQNNKNISPLAFHQELIQTLTTNPSPTRLSAIMDLALTSSIIEYTNKSKTPLIPIRTICDLLSCWCNHLSCDELPVLLNYLFSRTKLMCRLSKVCPNELPFLKFANGVLGRITDIELAGHWMVFMANFVDIDSRSGQNHLGNFNIQNRTIPDQPQVCWFAVQFLFDEQRVESVERKD